MNTRTLCFCSAVLLFISLPCQGKIVVFGDSLSDTGNIHDVTGFIPDADDGYYDGRFSNGPVWVESLAYLLGEPSPTPSRTGGANYAHGGSLVGSSNFLRPSLFDQVSDLPSANATDLYVIWAGGNDMLEVDLSLSLADRNFYAQLATAQINQNIDYLYSIGARNFLVLNLPPLGNTPLAKATLGSAELTKLNDLTEVFNWELSQELFKAYMDNAEIDIIHFDVFDLVSQAVQDPSAFGLVNVTDSATPFDANGTWYFPPGLATAGPATGVNPDEYLYYDGLHPTGVVHEMLGGFVALFVDEVPAETIVTVDSSADDAFSYDVTGALNESNELGSGNNVPTGITIDEDGFRWVIDNDDYVYVYNAFGNKIGSWKALGLALPQGIALVGDDVLIVDRGTDQVFVYSGAAAQLNGSLAPTTSWNLKTSKGNKNPRGITSDGSSVWVVNAAGKSRVYKYSVSGSYQGKWDLGYMNPSGIAIGSDQSSLWVVDARGKTCHRYDNAASRTKGSAAANASFPLNSANSNVQGVAVASLP